MPLRPDVVGALVDDLLGDLGLATHGVDGDDRALDRQQLQQLGDRGDLVGFLVHRAGGEHELLDRTPGRDHVHRAVAERPVEGAARGLAVDCDHALHSAREALRPGDEAGLETLRVERAEDEAELIVARRTVGEGQEATQER